MSEQIITNDKEFLKRYNKCYANSQSRTNEKEYCNICNEEKYWTGKCYVHNCKATLSSGKSLKSR